MRCLSFLVQPVLLSLGCDPLTQLGVFAVWNIAVPLTNAIVGKLAQTAFPDGVPQLPPVAFDGGFEFGSFWEFVFAEPPFRLVCSESEFIGCDAAAAIPSWDSR
jgi:hypothetical protein